MNILKNFSQLWELSQISSPVSNKNGLMTWNLGATIKQMELFISSTFVEDEVEFKKIIEKESPDN